MTLGVLEDYLVIQPCFVSQCDDSGHHSRKHPAIVEGYTMDLKGYNKVTNILKEGENTINMNKQGESRV